MILTDQEMLSLKNGFARAHYSQPQFSKKENYEDPEEQERVKETISLIPMGISSVLDVGCGNGIITNRLISRYKVLGLDLNKEALTYVIAPKIVGNVGYLPFRDESFDLVLCLEVLEHLPCRVYEKAIEELQRVAKRFIIISVPNEENIEQSFVKCSYCGCIFSESGHLRLFTIQKLVELFPELNLKHYRFCGKIRPRYNKYFLRIRHFLGIWAKTDRVICPLCGSNFRYRKSSVKHMLNICLILLSLPFSLRRLIVNHKSQKRWLIALYNKQ